ncbi:glycosyl hydrolase [Paraflavitalea soli]|uniref:glycosyl hydrolase n=1 Tax=Paraflavitalea soli TaxID=2315862 RepID=UPI0013C40AD9|nr:glycosyl hydrolase [Paraflavitalea soli]
MSLVLGGSWFQHSSTAANPIYPKPGTAGPLVNHLQENLPNSTTSPLPADTIGRLTDDFFQQLPASARPWVLWYWMQAGVSKAGITADLEAMHEAGIGGAHLVCIKDTTSPPLFNPPIRQLTPEWWGMVRFALEEAKRLNLKMAIHVGDGYALAGGPWITPELSMQKLVWSKEYVKGGAELSLSLPQPETNEDYYKDIAILAYPANSTQAFSDTVFIPKVSTSMPGAKAQFLAFDNGGKDSFKSDSVCWIQYKYPQPFTCRSITIHSGGNNYQAHRLLVQVSNDGYEFTTVTRLEPPRHGWQDTDEDVTHAIPATTASYFRFVYDKVGSEPGAEDLDAAKWKPSLKLAGIYLSDEPVLNQYEGKNGSIWRVSKKTTVQQAPDSVCVPLLSIVNLTGKMDDSGKLSWQAPAGNWVIVRIGHTSTGHTNATGGGGKGLECDKFNPAAIQLQFDKWFGETVKVAGPELAKEVIKLFYIDSWECGSQNWSPVFPAEFKKRRGYDLQPYLLAMTGTPVESAAVSEGFLYDVRQTIAALVADNFYGTLAKLAHEQGTQFTAESVAPTMLSDGMLHYRYVDIPMGEFWLNSPTHDKPNDMLDAISAGHIYGKRIIQAESFTTLRMNWDEHPGMLKALGDRNFSLGVNRLVLHVFTHNPWIDRKPGMTLDGVGGYFQRDQTWWKPGKAWMEYLQRSQAMLQLGQPVADVAIFTGEELPRRAVLPERLVTTLPGIMGQERVASETRRMVNAGIPLRQRPAGVTHSANMADPEEWIDPLWGYAYDAINPDALLRLATVKNKRIVLPGGASYGVLVLPAANTLNPDPHYMSAAVEQKIAQLVKDGATVVMSEAPTQSPSLQDMLEKKVLRGIPGANGKKAGGVKGKLLTGAYTAESFAGIGIERDVTVTEKDGKRAPGVAWAHRKGKDFDIYFISNQLDSGRLLNVSVRLTGKEPEIWDAVSGGKRTKVEWERSGGRTIVPMYLYKNESLFLVFRRRVENTFLRKGQPYQKDTLQGDWLVQFDDKMGGPVRPVVFHELTSWTEQADTTLHHYSGTAVYAKRFDWPDAIDGKPVWLLMDSISNLARVIVNGIDCGTAWTPPYRINIAKGLKRGINELEIEVTNTWANRLIGDERLPAEKRITWTTAPFRLQGKPLLPAGLMGQVILMR